MIEETKSQPLIFYREEGLNGLFSMRKRNGSFRGREPEQVLKKKKNRGDAKSMESMVISPPR